MIEAKEDINERRSQAHEKLLMHAYIALSKPPPEIMREKGEEWQNEVGLPANGKQPIVQHPSYNQQIIPDGPYFPDTENQIPPSFHNNKNNMQSRPMSSNSQALEYLNNHHDEKSKGSLVSGKSKAIAYQRHVLEKFCVRIKHMAVEVLKINREKKWQTRYLTVSKEGTWLKNNAKSDACFCPLGLLWVKKFSKSKEHSVLTIDKQGRGGILLANLMQVTLSEVKGNNSDLTKSQLRKYHDSCVINLHAKSSFVTLRCDRNDADAILIGCNAIIDVLRGTSKSSEGGNTNGSVMRPHSRQSGVAHSTASHSVNHVLSKTYVANDLWEA